MQYYLTSDASAANYTEHLRAEKNIFIRYRLKPFTERRYT